MKKIHTQIIQGLAVVMLLVATTCFAQTQPTSPSASSPTQAQQTSESQTNQPQGSTMASAPKVSAPPVAPVVTTNPSTASQLASLMGGLVLILMLIFGLSWFVKRFSQGGFMQNPAIKILAAMPLGTRERLMLVSIGDKQILLGVTATQISNLHVFDYPVVTAGEKEPGSDFSQKLMAILQQKNISPSGDSSPRDHQA